MLQSPELQRAVDRLATRLGMPLVLEDADQQLVVYSPHEDLVDSMRQSSILRRATPRATVTYFDDWNLSARTEPFLVPEAPASSVLPRLCLPIRREDRLLGFIWGLLPAGTSVLPEIGDISSEVAEVVLALEESFEEVARGSELLIGLLSSLPEERERAAAALGGRFGFGPLRELVVAVCQGPAWAQPSVRRSFWNTPLGRPGSGQIKALLPERGVALIAVDRGSPSERTVLESAWATVMRAAEGARITLTLGSVAATPTDVHLSYVDAVHTARAALMCGLNGVATWDDLGPIRFLCRLDDADMAAAVDPRIQDLVDHEPALAATLENYLEAAGSIKRVAEELHVHRATLYQRLERLEKYGIDLRSGRDRSAAHLSLLALRLQGDERLPLRAVVPPD